MHLHLSTVEEILFAFQPKKAVATAETCDVSWLRASALPGPVLCFSIVILLVCPSADVESSLLVLIWYLSIPGTR